MNRKSPACALFDDLETYQLAGIHGRWKSFVSSEGRPIFLKEKQFGNSCLPAGNRLKIRGLFPADRDSSSWNGGVMGQAAGAHAIAAGVTITGNHIQNSEYTRRMMIIPNVQSGRSVGILVFSPDRR